LAVEIGSRTRQVGTNYRTSARDAKRKIEDALPQLAKPLADGKPVRLRFAVLSKAKVPELVVHDVSVNSHQIEGTKRIVERVWRSIQAGFFFPSPSAINCHSCPYRQPCGAWKG
jgi:hypothetical protein